MEASNAVSVDAITEQLKARAEELKPLVEEFQRIDAALQALGVETDTPVRRGPGRPRGSGRKAAAK
jgi:hypothetical protein